MMRRTLLLAAVLAMIPAVARAQIPATSVPPGSVSGVVRDVNGEPLAGVNVSLLGEAATTRTDTAGQFILRDIPAGGHTALFRRLGFRSIEYRWTSRPGRDLQIAVAMTPVPRQLDRVIVEAPITSHRRGTSSIGGSVTDSAGHAVRDADVRLLGTGLSTVTDSGGGFEFEMLAAGSYLVRARRNGLASATVVMQIADEDHRGITMKMFGLPQKTGVGDTATASGYGVSDAGFDAFDHRARIETARPVLGPGDLFRADRARLDVLLQQYRENEFLRRRRSATVDVGVGSTDDGDCLLIDGMRSTYQPLRTYSSLDVQLVEVFRANAAVDGYVVAQMESLKECRGSVDRHPSYFVLWTRSMR